jgi:hypothetical protein
VVQLRRAGTFEAISLAPYKDPVTPTEEAPLPLLNSLGSSIYEQPVEHLKAVWSSCFHSSPSGQPWRRDIGWGRNLDRRSLRLNRPLKIGYLNPTLATVTNSVVQRESIYLVCAKPASKNQVSQPNPGERTGFHTNLLRTLN